MSLVRTFDTTDQRGGILRNLLPLAGYPALVWRNRYMVQNFFRRDLMSRFHGSFLGAWWMLVQPIFLFAIYFLVFGVLYGRVHTTGDGPNRFFAVYLFIGVMVYHSLSEATTSCVQIVTNNSNLVKKVAFPSEALPIHVAMVSLVMYLVGAIVGVIGAISFVGLYPDWHLLMLPLNLIVHFVLVIGMGLFLANANVFIRDVGQLWRIIVMAWMFLSPVFWQPSMMIKKLTEPVANVFFACNPAYSLMMAHRIALVGELGPEYAEYGVNGYWGHIGVAAIWAFSFLAVGYTMFHASKHKYADVV